MPTFHLLVGTFHTPQLYTLTFNVVPDFPPNLHVIHRSNAVGSHSWLHLSHDKKSLYATAWTDPPTLVAYSIKAPNEIHQINRVPTAARSGYVTASDKAVYSAGGASGEVFALDPFTGGFAMAGEDAGQYKPLQTLSFVDEKPQKDDGTVMDFGGLRHGAHSADLSPDGKALFVADIGRNAIFIFAVHEDGTLKLAEKHISPRRHDGPRHTWPHPAGKYLYSLQEHSSMVDVFEIDPSSLQLKHVQGVRIIPERANEKDFWADEVRTSFSHGSRPEYLFASTRGLRPEIKGYVAAFRLTQDGLIDDGGAKGKEQAGLIALWETPTSGGWANAIQPGPTIDGIEYIALTDSEEDLVMVLSWDGKSFAEVSRVKVDEGAGAATAVWLTS